MPVQFIPSSSMCELVKRQKYDFGEKRKKMLHVTSSRDIFHSPATNGQISSITKEFQYLEVINK